MVTKKQTKPAGRAIAEAEVKTVQHDAILQWLIDHLDGVVAHHFGLGPEAVRVSLKRAQESMRSWVDGVAIHSLNELEKQGFELTSRSYIRGQADTVIRLSRETVSSLKKAVMERDNIIEAVNRVVLPDTAGDASLESYEVMKPVCKIERTDRGHLPDRVKTTEMGYIDVVAKAFIPKSHEFKIAGFQRADQSEDVFRFSSSDADVLKTAEAFRALNLKIATTGHTKEIWFSVRSEGFTLGEILQELKAIQGFEDGDQSVALVVDQIASSMRAHIEHEGFVVIERNAHQQAGLSGSPIGQ